MLSLSLLLGGCASLPGALSERLASFSFLHSYESVLRDFEGGRIMEARAKALAFPKDHEDYARVRKLLNTKIEPARVRLLRHYRRLAEREEGRGNWYRAAAMYAQAAAFASRPDALRKRSEMMRMRTRQVRLDALIQARRDQDRELLSWQSSYDPPKGVAPKDEAFSRMRRQYEEMLDARAQLARREAKRWLDAGYPELAWIEAESYARLAPDSEGVQALLKDVRAKMPKALTIPKDTPRKRKTAVKPSKRPKPLRKVTAQQVRVLLHAGKLLEARRYALAYRREGGKGADTLLKQVNKAIAARAEDRYMKGRLAFRKEQLDQAIEYWSEAVRLMPDNQEYVQALDRAMQLKERLDLLRQSASEQVDPSADAAADGKENKP
ncbi:MAG: 4-hydroxy-3-methylbut-2-en-1-yl diphosphate synthase [Mariprofundaceae bacterium]